MKVDARGEPLVYGWITGEETNLGDSLLRRPYVSALTPLGRLQLWTNRNSSDFLENVGVPPGTRTFRGFPGWYLSLIINSLRERTIIALNAGEFTLSAGRASFLVLMRIAQMIVRVRGGSVIWAGVSIRPGHSRYVNMISRRAAETFELVRYRDDSSRQPTRGVAGMPDWGFGLGSAGQAWTPRAERDRLAIVMRGDRPLPSAEWIRWVSATCTHLDLKPLIVVQVRADTDRAHELAALIGASVLPWPCASTHREQEAAVRDAYRGSAVTIGDRLHGLIVAATEGSVPLGWVESSSGKIRRHFSVVGMEWTGENEGRAATDLPPIDRRQIDEWSGDLVERIAAARTALSETADEIAAYRGPSTRTAK